MMFFIMSSLRRENTASWPYTDPATVARWQAKEPAVTTSPAVAPR